MAIQITVIGLGQVGASVGLALADHKDKLFRCGHDPDPLRMKRLQKEGAFDKTFYNLPESVRDADIVLLALPVDQIEDTLKYISEDLKPEAVIIDTSPFRKGSREWAKKLLPKDRHFVSMTPVINPLYLDEKLEEALTPHFDLFEKGEMMIASEIDTHPDAVKLASDLAGLLKSKPFYVDPDEADGISSEVETLPKLVAASLILSAISRPGWKDSRRFASKAFHRTASAIQYLDEENKLGTTAILDQENVTRSLDEVIAVLQEIRVMIADGDADGISLLLKESRRGYDSWLDQRQKGDWNPISKEDMPTFKSVVGGLFGIRKRGKNIK